MVLRARLLATNAGNERVFYTREAGKGRKSDGTLGNRVLTKEHLEEVVLDPTGFKPFTLDTPFESGFLLQHIEGNLA